jgi:hypothetical protein
MRTTVDLDDALFRRAKAQAAMEGIPLKDLLERGVRLALEKGKTKKKPFRVKFPLLDKGCKQIVDVPPDIVHRLDEHEDRERYEASL